jgi:type IV secretion system protein VirD4
MKKFFTKKNLIMYIPALLMGLFCNWVSCVGRIEFEGNYLNGFNGIFANPRLIIKAFPMSLNPIDLIVLFVAAAAVILFQYNVRLNRKNYKTGKEHGSAKWGKPEDIKPFINPTYNQNIILSKTEMLTMESRPADRKTERNKNVLVVGGTGSGKTRNVIKPNIMQMNASYVITDPKGTILNELGYMLERGGYKIKVLNLIDLNKSMRYNPLVYIKKPSDILKLIDTIILNTDGSEKDSSGDKFWVKSERLLYQALIAAVFFDFPEHEKNLGSITSLLSMMEVREGNEAFKNKVDLWFNELRGEYNMIMNDKNAPEEKITKAKNLAYAITQYDSFKLAAGKTAKSILISCAARLSAINIPEVRELLSEDELALEKIGTEKTALFIIIPDSDETYNFIVSIMYTQLFNLLFTLADTKFGGRLPIHVRCILDEFANIGKIPEWERKIATMRSREISAMMVVQTKSQLKALYKDHAETIIGNCDSEIFLGGKEPGTLKEIAESLGKETINDYNTTDNRGPTESKGVNYSKLGRELMSQSELAVMERGKCVVQVSGLYPFFSDKYDITQHPMYRFHADGKKDKKWFEADKYIKKARFATISMPSLIRNIPFAARVKETARPLRALYEGDEVYVEMTKGVET